MSIKFSETSGLDEALRMLHLMVVPKENMSSSIFVEGDIAKFSVEKHYRDLLKSLPKDRSCLEKTEIERLFPDSKKLHKLLDMLETKFTQVGQELRNYPQAGGIPSLHVLLFARGYGSKAHCLYYHPLTNGFISIGDFEQICCERGPVCVVVPDEYPKLLKYGDRSARFIYLEAGHFVAMLESVSNFSLEKLSDKQLQSTKDVLSSIFSKISWMSSRPVFAFNLLDNSASRPNVSSFLALSGDCGEANSRATWGLNAFQNILLEASQDSYKSRTIQLTDHMFGKLENLPMRRSPVSFDSSHKVDVIVIEKALDFLKGGRVRFFPVFYVSKVDGLEKGFYAHESHKAKFNDSLKCCMPSLLCKISEKQAVDGGSRFAGSEVYAGASFEIYFVALDSDLESGTIEEYFLAGSVCQRLIYYLSTLGLDCRCIGAVYEDKLLWNINTVGRSYVLYAMAFGKGLNKHDA